MASHCIFIGRIDAYENSNAADRISPNWNQRTILLCCTRDACFMSY